MSHICPKHHQPFEEADGCPFCQVEQNAIDVREVKADVEALGKRDAGIADGLRELKLRGEMLEEAQRLLAKTFDETCRELRDSGAEPLWLGLPVQLVAPGSETERIGFFDVSLTVGIKPTDALDVCELLLAGAPEAVTIALSPSRLREKIEEARTVRENTCAAPKTASLCEREIDRLAKFIMSEVPGEPSQSQGAVDTAIRIMRAQMKRIEPPDRGLVRMALDELGVPGAGYPAPVANAVSYLRSALGLEG